MGSGLKALGRSLHFSEHWLPSWRSPKVLLFFKVSSTVWRVMRNTESLGSHGPSEHLPFLKASHPGLCHLLIVRRLFRKGTPHRSHRTSNNGGHLCIGGTTRTTLISSHLKGFLPYTALKPVESSLRACLTSHAIFVVISTD